MHNEIIQVLRGAILKNEFGAMIPGPVGTIILCFDGDALGEAFERAGIVNKGIPKELSTVRNDPKKD